MIGDASGRAELAAALSGQRALVAGLGVTGASAADFLLDCGAEVVVVDAADGPAQQERAARLATRGVEVLLGSGRADVALAAAGQAAAVLIVSPGWRPDSPLLRAAAAAGTTVMGDVELARRVRPELPWLAITGTNGKSTTVRMTEAMLRAAGYRAVAAGNIGLPLLDVVTDDSLDAIAVELGSFQLHYTTAPRAVASVVLNLADDHLDWHGSFAAYAAAKGRIHRGATAAAVYNTADAETRRLVAEADVAEGCRAVGFGLGAPAAGEFGVVEELLVDRAFAPPGEAVELATLSDVVPFAPHNVANALAAAALVRAFGVGPEAVRDGLRGFAPEPHRLAEVPTGDGVRWIDDSKATNCHAADAALRAFDRVVWIAGGLAKGQRFDELVSRHAGRMRGAVLIGADRALLAEAFARHAPDVPVCEVAATDDGAMDAVVDVAAGWAEPGDVVLLSPACASMDMFTDYGARGDAFAAAVRRRR